MKISPFLIERHFAKYEFEVPYQLSCSDCEPLSLVELVAMASPETLHLWETLKLNYTDSKGHPLLRKEISHFYTGISADDLLVCVPEEGIFLVMSSMLNAGDHVVVISPSYQSLKEIAIGTGCRVSLWEAGPDGSFKLESLTALVNPETRMIVVNFPHNPTGAHISADEFVEISKYCDERDILLFSDEMYRGLEQDPADLLPCAASLSKSAISLSGMSKSFALPGLRIGWLVCRNRQTTEKLLQMKDYVTICSSAPSEVLAIMALQNRDRILTRNIAIIRDNIRLVNDFVGRNMGKSYWREPSAGSVAFLYLSCTQNIEAFCQDVLEKKEVLAIGSHLFNHANPAIRLGLGRTGFVEALERLENYLSGGGVTTDPFV